MTTMYEKRLLKIYDAAERIFFDENSRIVLMSDCHRGDGSWADSLAQNQNTYFFALMHYYKNDYTYIEIGDGDELWENKQMADIIEAHRDVFWLLSLFYQQGRLYLMFGNHDMVKKSPAFVRRNLYSYFDVRIKAHVPLFPNIRLHEGLVLVDAAAQAEIFLVHGHQVEMLNSGLWKLARFLVRYFWKPLEMFGVNDPTSAAKNMQRTKKTEARLKKWTERAARMMVAGHTHRPVLPEPGAPRYFNDGSCVHPRCITAIEIAGGEIVLVKWSVKTRDDGTLHIAREVLAGPQRLKAYV